ncbi:hypothetical protein ENHY17A_10207 [Moraxellaceae bacterium 17A]|nr:hypothetical protein ENHY17A_10207 [Moraxellaceae bacterium 17A]
MYAITHPNNSNQPAQTNELVTVVSQAGLKPAFSQAEPNKA